MSSRTGDVNQAEKSFMGMPVRWPCFTALSSTIAIASPSQSSIVQLDWRSLGSRACAMAFDTIVGQFWMGCGRCCAADAAAQRTNHFERYHRTDR